MASQYHISPWGATQTYKTYDVINGIQIGSTTHPTPCHLYATQNSVGQHPSGVYVYNITSISSSEDIATVNFSQTGNVPNVTLGSIVKIAGTASNNYTGMAIAGTSGQLRFINPGFADTAGAAGTVTMSNPAFTTGFFFVPDYSSKLSTQNQTITTQFGGGYSQSMPAGLNPHDQSPTWVYQNIGGRMMKAINDYVQETEGSRAFEVLIPDQYLNNQPHQKWTAQSVDTTPASYGLYDVSVSLKRSYNP